MSCTVRSDVVIFVWKKNRNTAFECFISFIEKRSRQMESTIEVVLCLKINFEEV